MTVIPVAAEMIDSGALQLERYAQILGISECAFFGVNEGVGQGVCRPIWSLSERITAAQYLVDAQAELEKILKFPLGKRWFTDNQKPYHCATLTEWKYLLEAGVKVTTNISLAEAVVHTVDPAVIGPVATTVTSEDEIHVFHPGTDIEINPSAISIAGGNVTIDIPRCRLVTLAAADNPSNGLDYSDTSGTGPFEQTVDVKRVYNDPSTQAELISNHECSVSCSSLGCTAFQDDGCIYITDPVIGAVEVYPASYSGGVWSRKSIDCHCNYRYAVLNYRAGVDLTPQLESMIVRLAHSKMPMQPCGCDEAIYMWKTDRNIPTALTRERVNCPFGLSDGAWYAWENARTMMVYRMGVM